MRVSLIASTQFHPPLECLDQLDYRPEGPALIWDGSDLVEFAGRACYQSWSRPNPKTATNAGYIKHILEVGHLSVLEHASASFYIEDVSRSLTHELVRHRHLSYSQLSQRFVDESDAEFVLPPAVAEGSDGASVLEDAFGMARHYYRQMVASLSVVQPKLTRKQIREAARAVLPNATETKIVITGNYRAWRHFIELRSSPAADAEIQELALNILNQLNGIAPNVFGDLMVNQRD